MSGTVLAVALLLGGLVAVVFSARLFLQGAVGLSRRFGLPEVVVGAVVMAIGTSAPELAINIIGSLEGAGDVVVSNIIGSNIVNLGLGIGLAGLIHSYRPFRKAYLAAALLGAGGALGLLFITLAGGEQPIIGRAIGVVLLGVAIVYIASTFRAEHSDDDVPADIAQRALWLLVLELALGMGGMALGAELTVSNATSLAQALHIPDAVIGATIIAAGSSLPEIVACIVAARGGHPGVAIGNVVGSQVFNIFAILGISALVAPVFYSPHLAYDMVALVGISIIFLSAFFIQPMRRHMGAAMLACYSVYALYLLAEANGY